MTRPPQNQFARNDTATPTRKWCGRPKPDIHWNDAPGFSGAQHSAGRIIFGRGRPYYFGRIGFWQPHHFRGQTAVSFSGANGREKTGAMCLNFVIRLEDKQKKVWCPTNQRKTNKKRRIRLFVPTKKEKRKKKALNLRFFPFFGISSH